jgi:hypothetical protein
VQETRIADGVEILVVALTLAVRKSASGSNARQGSSKRGASGSRPATRRR